MSRQPDLGVDIAIPDISELAKAYAQLPKGLSAATMAAACKRALKPALAVLRKNTPKGPTGNLRRAADLKSVRYNKTGTGVAVVGYRKAETGSTKSASGGTVRKGRNLGFHQFFVEFGTNERRIKKLSKRGFYIASSFNRLGPFSMKGKSLGFMGMVQVRTTPKYPKAFFRAFPAGAEPVLPAMPPQHVIQRTSRSELPVAGRALQAEMADGLRRAQKQLEIRAAKANAKKQAAIEAAAAKANPATPF